MIASGVIAATLLVAYTIVLIPFTPSIADLRKAKAETPSVLMSSDGKELAVFKRMNREWVTLDEISPYVVKALITTEDHRFYEHHGVDLKRTAAGIVRTLQGEPEGGSTLTQQLARNLYPEEIGRKRTITRKLKELITALKIEYAYSKQEILLTYLNTMPFLYNAFGIEMGARTYFDKSAADLNLLESATLVGMLKGTSYYNPVLNSDRAVKRRNVVLAQMVKRGVLGQAEFDKLKVRPIRLDFERQQEEFGKTPHFAANVRKWLIEWADRNDYNLYSDGLVITSTIDSRMQQFAEQAVQRQLQTLQAGFDAEKGLSLDRSAGAGPQRRSHPFGSFGTSHGELVDAFIRESSAYRAAIAAGTAPDAALKQIRKDSEFMTRLAADKTRMETGFVAIDPTNGQVKAWVGSRNFAVDQFDHVSLARRQPGSTFKAFVYGAALEKGMTPDTRFTDSQVEIPMGNGSVWRPSDVHPPSGREMTLREALAYSKNTITAQVIQQVGPRRVVSFARKLGVDQSPLDPVPALALGTSPVTLFEMATAYSTIADGGEYRKPILVSRITDKDGKVLETFSSASRRVMTEKTAYDLADMMRSVVNQGTGRAIRAQYGIRADVAGKTGTTQDNTDGWFMLMHHDLVAGAWVGFNDARVAMRSSHWGEGARTALPIVGDFYRRTLHTRLIDANARFATPPASFFDAVMDKLHGWFGGEKQEKEVVRPRPRPSASTPTSPASPAAPAEVPDIPDAPAASRSDEMDRITNQAREDAQPSESESNAGEIVPAEPAKPRDAGTPAVVPAPDNREGGGPAAN
ncbi:MAG TPA: transglycosylase domain-containing protein [Noviherbaspirillum sp.]|nr:transglycosylase domain-containing protein [Noviherbaspirillum sp.]HJV84619.1 transglycosylase domain-containing protein [Noviherbaspirillum sp.]